MSTSRPRAHVCAGSTPLVLSTDELRWHKSSASDPDNCLEAAFTGHATLVRDSLHPDGATLSVPLREWVAFLSGVTHAQGT